MPIYEFYCPQNHTVYQFYAKTLAQGKTIPRCPDNPKFRLEKMLSTFAVKTGGAAAESEAPTGGAPAEGADDARMEAAMGAMEREFSAVDENDPRAMGRMMRRMAEITGEKIDGQMEEVVRRLEEGADPDSLEEQLGDGGDDEGGAPEGAEQTAGEPREKKRRFKPLRTAPKRDPRLYDYE